MDVRLNEIDESKIIAYENKEWLDYKIGVREKLRLFTLIILELSKHREEKIVNNQLTRSGSSTYANCRAALRGRSSKEVFC